MRTTDNTASSLSEDGGLLLRNFETCCRTRHVTFSDHTSLVQRALMFQDAINETGAFFQRGANGVLCSKDAASTKRFDESDTTPRLTTTADTEATTPESDGT